MGRTTPTTAASMRNRRWSDETGGLSGDGPPVSGGMMKDSVLRRLGSMALILLGLSFCVFALMYLAPGDPASMKLKAQGVAPTDEMLARTRQEMGLNDPFLVQYGRWLAGLLRGDLGTSYKDGRPVGQKLAAAAGKTAALAASALALALLVSVPLGMVSAVFQNRWPDRLVQGLTFLSSAMPRFLLALLLMYVLCLRWRLLPVVAAGSFKSMILPTVTLALGVSTGMTRQVRAETLEQLSRGYVVGERVRGDTAWVIFGKNVFHNAMINLLSAVALSAAGLLGGSVVVETIFQWPGLGKLVMDAISNRDYPVVQGFALLMSAVYMAITFVSDLICRKLDPRIGSGRGEER